MSVTFTFESLEIELPNPELGNQEQIARNFVWAKSMAGTLRSYVRDHTTGPQLILTFTLRSDEQVEELLVFLKAVQSEEFTYTESYATGSSVEHTVKLPDSVIGYSWSGRYTRDCRITLEDVS